MSVSAPLRFVLRPVVEAGDAPPKEYSLRAETLEDAVCVAAMIFDQAVAVQTEDPTTKKLDEGVIVARLPRAWYLHDDFGIAYTPVSDGVASKTWTVFGFRSRRADSLEEVGRSFFPGTLEERDVVDNMARGLEKELFCEQVHRWLAQKGHMTDPIFCAAVAFTLGGFRRFLSTVGGSGRDQLELTRLTLKPESTVH